MHIRYENILYWLSSLLINLILFTFMSLILLIEEHWEIKSDVLNVILQEQIPPELKVGEARKSRNKSLTSSIKAKEHGDYAVPEVRKEALEDISILAKVEREVKSRRGRISEGAQVGPKEIGSLTAVLSSEGVGISSTGGRAVVYIPPAPEIIADEPPSPVKVRIWVEPSGRISHVEILQRSGVPSVDRKILSFVKGIRFEPVEEQVQTGILTFKFKGG